MTLPLIAFLLAVVVPIFFSKIRTAPFWLVLQAMALGWNALAHHGADSMHGLMALLELLLLRGAIAPLLLRRAIAQRAQPNLDLMPSNLFTWVAASALIVLAFKFGAPSMGDYQAITLGVACSTVIVALLLLATNDAPPAQLVAVLVMENALALFESLFPEPWPLPVHGALSAIYLLTIIVGTWLIGTPDVPVVEETA